jgi:hypothetical protein
LLGGYLDCQQNNDKQRELFARVVEFVENSTGLKKSDLRSDAVCIQQLADHKEIWVHLHELEDVLLRSDTEAQEFIQINFCHGKKLLLTDRLVGFKPISQRDLETNRLPRVVTTPDILSVFETIQETYLEGDISSQRNITVLKQIFEAVLKGGEAVGFDLAAERSWLNRFPAAQSKTQV